MDFLKRLWNDEEGQGLVEYGVLVLLVVVLVIGIITLFGPQLQGIFTRIGTEIENVAP